jgi:hypothetical protein
LAFLMRVILKAAKGDKPELTLDVDPETPFSELSHCIPEEWGWPSDDICFFDNRRPLPRSATLITASLPDGATLLVAPLDDAMRPARDLDDPAVPDYVRNPVERTPLPEPMVEKLTEFGLSLRILRNAIRLTLPLNNPSAIPAAIDQALDNQKILITEADNAMVERALLENSGADRIEAEDALKNWQYRKREMNRIVAGPLFQKVTPNPWTEPEPELGPVDFTDLLQAGPMERRELLQRVRERIPGIGIQDGADLVIGLEKMRAVLMGGAARNPFHELQGVARRAFVQDEFEFCAGLGPKECRFVLEKMRDGKDAARVCDALRTAGMNFEDAEGILAAQQGEQGES